LIAIFVRETARFGEVALFFIAAAAIFGSRQVSGHGQFVPESLWVGSLLVIPTLAAVTAGVVMVDRYVPKIAEANVDYRHFLLGSVAGISLLSVVASLFWWVSTPQSAPLQRKEGTALPAFLSANAQTDERFKTLVIRNEGNQIRFFIARDQDLQLGEADVMVGLSSEVNQSIVNLVTGAGIDSSQVLAEFGIRYVFLAKPFNEELVRTIDSVGGFTRSSSTAEGITWKVTGALAHISLLSEDGTYKAIPSGTTGAVGTFNTTGTVIVTEKFDTRWRLLLNGKRVPATQTTNGVPRFVISEPGDFILYHDGTTRRAWVSFQAIAITTLFILALPARRRRSQMRPEELA